MLTYQLRITGSVQGVGFRESLRRVAEREGVGGWVRNRADGSVEALVQGPEAAVQRVLTWARRGPPAARVAALSASPAREGAAHAYAGFELRPTV
ncbi:MAG: acylphosphatase [Betaproteobacteria bacterium]|nr:acylphosphatase [Betaproteobacteria bacterium]